VAAREIGVLIDAAIVTVENRYRHLSEAGPVTEGGDEFSLMPPSR
jgi:Cu/Ag efflux pump CusA